MERSRTLNARSHLGTNGGGAVQTGTQVQGVQGNGTGSFSGPSSSSHPDSPSPFDDEKLHEDANLSDYPCYLPNVDVVTSSSSSTSFFPLSSVRDDLSQPYHSDSYLLSSAPSFDEESPCSSTGIYESTWACEAGAVPAVSSASSTNSTSPSSQRTNHNSMRSHTQQARVSRVIPSGRPQPKSVPPPRTVKREEVPVDEEQARSISETVEQVVQKLRHAPKSSQSSQGIQSLPPPEPRPHTQVTWRERARARLRARRPVLGDGGEVDEDLEGMDDAELEKALLDPIPKKRRRTDEVKMEQVNFSDVEGEEGVVSALELIGPDPEEGVPALDLIEVEPQDKTFQLEAEVRQENVLQDEIVPLKSHTSNRESFSREPCSAFGDQELEVKFKLIGLIKERPHLWRPDILVPYRSALFEKLWTEVSDACGKSKPWCLKFWQILRQVYNLRVKRETGTPETQVFHFMDAMDFYRPFAGLKTSAMKEQHVRTHGMLDEEHRLILISAVKEMELWKNKKGDQHLWEALAEQVGRNVEICRQEWKILRRHYSDFKKGNPDALDPLYAARMRYLDEDPSERRKQKKRKKQEARPKSQTSPLRTDLEKVLFAMKAKPTLKEPLFKQEVVEEDSRHEQNSTSVEIVAPLVKSEAIDEKLKKFFIPSSDSVSPTTVFFKPPGVPPKVIDARVLGTKPLPKVPEMNLSDMKLHVKCLEAISRRPALWEKDDYSSGKWEDVAREVKKDVDWVLAFWKEVRMRFHMHLTKKERDSRAWWHLEDALAFYRPTALMKRAKAQDYVQVPHERVVKPVLTPYSNSPPYLKSSNIRTFLVFIQELQPYASYEPSTPIPHSQPRTVLLSAPLAYTNQPIEYRTLAPGGAPIPVVVTSYSSSATYIVDPNGYSSQLAPPDPPQRPPPQPRKITPPPVRKPPPPQREIEPEPENPRKAELDKKAQDHPEEMTLEERAEWKRLRAAELKRYARNTGHFDISFLYED